MSDMGNTPNEGSDRSTNSADNSWQEVGRQFQALGESLAQAVRSAWEEESTQRRVQEMRTGLEAMVRDVSKAIEDSASSPKGQKVRREAERTAESVRVATEQTVQEVRPQLITALEQLNQELQKLINRMEQHSTPPPASPPPEENEPPQNG